MIETPHITPRLQRVDPHHRKSTLPTGSLHLIEGKLFIEATVLIHNRTEEEPEIGTHIRLIPVPDEFVRLIRES